MRMGLDARTLVAPRPRGTGRNLADAYRQITQLRPDWEFVLYHQRPFDPTQREAADEPLWRRENVILRRVDGPGDRLEAWLHWHMPRAARRDGVDLLHFPANTAPWRCGTPHVVTVHDLIPLQLPDECDDSERRRFETGVRRAALRARRIITPSTATAEALRRRSGPTCGPIDVIPWAPDAGLVAALRRDAPDAERVRHGYDLERDWLLAFSGASPRKNTAGIIAAFARLPAAQRHDVQLLIVGCEPVEQRAALSELAADLAIGPRVRICGFAPASDLPHVLGGARGLVFASRAEGFGLPVLDALAVGVPVLASDLPCIRATAGDAALYCAPDDFDSIAAGMGALLEHETAADLVARGQMQAENFTWERTAQAMCTAYAAAAAPAGAAANTTVEVGA